MNEDQSKPSAILSDLLAQREEIFEFTVVERIYDRGLAELESVGNRVGVLLAAQIAIASVLVDKIDEFGVGPARRALRQSWARRQPYFSLRAIGTGLPRIHVVMSSNGRKRDDRDHRRPNLPAVTMSPTARTQ